MAILDRVLQLQSQGMQDSDVIRILREENIPPMEIQDALNQAKIKAAVTGVTPNKNNATTQFSDMEQSMMEQTDLSPAPQEEMSYPQEQYSSYNQQPEIENQQYYYQPTGIDTETIAEISEQIAIEKISELQQRTGDLVAFRSEMQEKIKDLSERIKRIESSIDKIQQAIIGKIGEYGDNLNIIRKDMGNVHDTMSKLMNPLIDNFMEMKKLNQSKG